MSGRRPRDADQAQQIPEPIRIAMNDTLNFSNALISDDDIAYIVSLLDESCLSLLGMLNYGVPMPIHEIEAVFQLQLRHDALMCREVATDVIKLVVLCNHYYNSHTTLTNTIQQIRRVFSGANLERLEAGLARLYRATDSQSNAFYTTENIGRLDLPTGAYMKELRLLYDICNRAGLTVSDSAKESYFMLNAYNHIYKPPRYTSSEGVRMYADNLKNLAMRFDSPLRILTAEKRTRDPEETANDLMFALSMTNLMLMHQDELALLKQWILAIMNEMCATLYIAYLQVPSTSSLYGSVVDNVMRLTENGISESSERPVFSDVLAAMLTFIKSLYSANVYIVPSLFKFATFSVILSTHNVLEETEHTDEDDRNVELDPTSPYTNARYMVKNPFGRRPLFKCPDNLVKHLRQDLVKSEPVQAMLTEWSNQTVTFDYFRLDFIETLMIEGASRQLKMLPEQLSEYLDKARSDARVLDRCHFQGDDSVFADVRVRTIPRTVREDARRRPDRAHRRGRTSRPYERHHRRNDRDSDDDLSARLSTAHLDDHS